MRTISKFSTILVSLIILEFIQAFSASPRKTPSDELDTLKTVLTSDAIESEQKDTEGNDDSKIDLVTPNDGPVNASFECNVELVKAYGLNGIPRPHNAPSQSCPKLIQSCCSLEDDAKSLFLWNDEKPYIEAHFNAVLSFYRYTLGFADQAFRSAQFLYDTTNEDCRLAVQDMIRLNLNKPRATEIYKLLVKSVKSVANIRKGFYCSICEAKFHLDHYFYASFKNSNFDKSIYYSNEFCQKYVNETISTNYFIVTFLKRYLENFAMLSNCKSGNTLKPKLNIELPDRTSIKNCFHFRHKYFFYYCQPYCKNFNLVKKNNIVDGNLEDLSVLFDVISKSIVETIDEPDNNFLVEGSVSTEAKFFETNYELAKEKTVFFESQGSNNYDLSTYQSGIVYLEGIDVYPPIEDSKYELVIRSSSILSAVKLFLFCFVFRLI